MAFGHAGGSRHSHDGLTALLVGMLIEAARASFSHLGRIQLRQKSNKVRALMQFRRDFQMDNPLPAMHPQLTAASSVKNRVADTALTILGYAAPATGVMSMMSFLTAIQTVAARRGDGLRPELARLLECRHPKSAEGEFEHQSQLSNENSQSPVILKILCSDK